MAKREKFTADQVIQAVKETKGLVYLAAKRLGCDPDTITNYSRRYARVHKAIRNARAEVVDVAENKLYAALQNGESWAVLFALKTLGRDRGYMEQVRQELTGAGGAPLTVSIIEVVEPETESSDGAGD